MQLSIIIINYNTFQLTSNCIKSIYKKLIDVEYEIVLVDNFSTECDPFLFKKEFPSINLIVSPFNSGFTGGNNLGIENATGKYLLLLNSDTELINNAPKICLDYLMQHKSVGMLTCQLLYPNGKIQYNCRRFRTITWELLEVFPFYKFLSKPKKGALMLHHYFDHKSVMECDWVWGAYMMFSKDIIQELPKKKLSDDFFMYCEDTLWCWDFKQLSYKIYFLPQAKVMHIHKGSVSKDKWLAIRRTSINNHAKFMHKYYPNWKWYFFTVVFHIKQYGIILYEKLFI